MKNIFSLSMVRKDPKKDLGSMLRRSSLICLMISALLISGFVFNPIASAGGYSDTSHWVGTWATSPVSQGQTFADQTLRQIVHISIGGDWLRARLSNRFGTVPLVIDAASIGIQEAGASVVPGSLRALTFGGETSIAIAAGAKVLSDPVKLSVADEADLAVSLYVSEDTGGSTSHDLAWQTSYISSGDQTGVTEMIAESTTTSWFWLTGVEVLADQEDTHAVVTLGDSITEGCCNFANVDTNTRYPDFLARLLIDRYPDEPRVAVLNEGISGNRILNDFFGPNAQVRLDPDVLTQSGVTHVILLEGINDIGFGVAFGEVVSADDIIAGYKQIIDRVHTMGLKILVGTLTPYYDAGYFSPDGETERQAVNDWIRTSNLPDGVVDFDRAMRDPSQPGPYPSLLPDYDSGDNLHPSVVGYEKMGEVAAKALFAPERKHYKSHRRFFHFGTSHQHKR
ncbi:MAG: SGNH/GDSL hydrolase family protein [Deltaproteobacteria bacterium]|jgi:lysophospholipase L1-like esterase